MEIFRYVCLRRLERPCNGTSRKECYERCCRQVQHRVGTRVATQLRGESDPSCRNPLTGRKGIHETGLAIKNL